MFTAGIQVNYVAIWDRSEIIVIYTGEHPDDFPSVI